MKRILALAMVLLTILATPLFSATQPASTQAAGLTIVRFYTISKKTVDTWLPSTNVYPSSKKVFAFGTKDVGYFVRFGGATPNVTTYHIVLDQPSGQVATGRMGNLSYKSGIFTNYFSLYPQFPDGEYTVKLVVNGKAKASETFLVGAHTQSR